LHNNTSLKIGIDKNMFRNIIYDTKKSVIHLWEQFKGENLYTNIPWVPYVFVSEPTGKIFSIDGIPVVKKEFDSYQDYYEYQSNQNNIFENNVRPEIQFLSERYYGIPDDETEFPNLKIYSIDIECYAESEFPTAQEARYPIVLVSIYDNLSNSTYTFSTKPYSGQYKQESWLKYYSYSTEEDMLYGIFSFLKRNPCDVLTGWNCLDENTNIFLSDKILKIKDVRCFDNLGKYGIVKNHLFTGNKKQCVIRTSFGNVVKCSEDHIFPVYMKLKEKYKNDKTLLKNKEDISVKDIKNKQLQNDVYLQVDRNLNLNCDLTYKKYVKNNFRNLVNNGLDIILPNNIVGFLKKNYPNLVKERVYDKVNCRYWKKTNLWCYNNFKDVLNPDMVSPEIGNDLYVIFNKHKYFINLNKKIDNNVLYLLGLIFTDGTFYKSEYSISNTNIGIVCGCSEIVNRYRKSKYQNISDIKFRLNEKKSHNKQYNIIFSSFNEIGVLKHMIYKGDNKKCISVELLSQLSYDQFISFLAGMIDGDGSVGETFISLCNYNGCINDISSLLSFNGFMPTVNKEQNIVRINYVVNFNKNGCVDIIKKLFHDKKRNIKFKNVIKKNSKSNNIKYFEYENFLLQKIESIETGEISPMFDMETSTNYFNCNVGIKTHNCVNFDLQYIINRCKFIFDDNTSAFLGLSPIKKVKSWYKNNEFNIDIAGVTILDYMDLIKWYHPNKLERYTLDFVCKNVLGKGKLDYSDYNNLNDLYNNNWDKFVDYNITDALRVFQLEEKLGYIKMVQSLSLLTKTPMKYYNVMNQLIEGMFLTYFRRNKMCAPYFSGGTQESYPAAIVKEPIPGLYEWVVDLDITSSYPSHIITLNMSTETYYGRIKDMTEDEVVSYVRKGEFPPCNVLTKKGLVNLRDDKLEFFNKALGRRLLSVAPCGTIFTTKTPGVISIMEQYVFDKRSDVRNRIRKMRKTLPDLRNSDLLNRKNKITQYNSLQLALKVILNAAYGITATPYSRYFNKDLAEAIVSCGRHTIKSGEKFVNKLLNQPPKELQDILDQIKKV